MRIFYFLFFISTLVFAQNPKLEVSINSITNQDISNSKREYQIHYQIENKTNNELSFFLLPNALIANVASSLTLYPVYKMYLNGIFEDMDGPFFEYETENELKLAKLDDKNSEEAKVLLKRIQTVNSIIASNYRENYQKNGGDKTDYKWIYQNQKLLNNIITLKPNETKLFTIKTLWNKNRFIKNEDLEFYLDSNNKIEIELILELKTNLFKDQLSDSDLEKINANPNFISGTFTSNKMELNFE